jgi:hypothetical protein
MLATIRTAAGRGPLIRQREEDHINLKKTSYNRRITPGKPRLPQRKYPRPVRHATSDLPPAAVPRIEANGRRLNTGTSAAGPFAGQSGTPMVADCESYFVNFTGGVYGSLAEWSDAA